MYGREQRHLYPATEYVLEIVREKIFRRLNNEIPYGVEFRIKHWDNSNADVFIVHIDLFIKSVSAGNILIGTDGECINYITENSKRDLEIFFKKSVVLRLRVIPLRKKIPSRPE